VDWTAKAIARYYESLWVKLRDGSPLPDVAAVYPANKARNVLDPKLSDIGIGMAEGSPSPGTGAGMIYVADFGDRGTVRQRGSRARPARRR
jgi:hypothetical protein